MISAQKLQYYTMAHRLRGYAQWAGRIQTRCLDQHVQCGEHRCLNTHGMSPSQPCPLNNRSGVDMAQLPYTITSCPDEPNPKQFTAMTPQLINALRFGHDMTINQNQHIWPAGSQGATQINTHKEKNDPRG